MLRMNVHSSTDLASDIGIGMLTIFVCLQIGVCVAIHSLWFDFCEKIRNEKQRTHLGKCFIYLFS